MAYKLPRYDTTKGYPLGAFLKELRLRVYGSAQVAGKAIGANRTTIERWEKHGSVSPTIREYLAHLTEANVDRFRREYHRERQQNLEEALLNIVNDVITDDETLREKGIDTFKNWAEICEVAEAYIGAQRGTKSEAQQAISSITPVTSEETKHYEKIARPKPPLHLPQRVQYFTGREKEIKEILDDLKLGGVVTICGPGGIGKTALAAEVVWELTADGQLPKEFPGGIVSHKFSTQSSVELAFEHILSCYGVARGQMSARDAVSDLLQDRHVLLHLDGVENVDDLKKLLEVRGQSTVLMTTYRAHDGLERVMHLTN